MEPRRFKVILYLLGDDGKPLSSTEAARIFRVNPRTIRRYKAGDRKIPPLVAEKAERLAQIAAAGRDWRRHA